MTMDFEKRAREIMELPANYRHSAILKALTNAYRAGLRGEAPEVIVEHGIFAEPGHPLSGGRLAFSEMFPPVDIAAMTVAGKRVQQIVEEKSLELAQAREDFFKAYGTMPTVTAPPLDWETMDAPKVMNFKMFAPQPKYSSGFFHAATLTDPGPLFQEDDDDVKPVIIGD